MSRDYSLAKKTMRRKEKCSNLVIEEISHSKKNPLISNNRKCSRRDLVDLQPLPNKPDRMQYLEIISSIIMRMMRTSLKNIRKRHFFIALKYIHIIRKINNSKVRTALRKMLSLLSRIPNINTN